MRLHQSNHLKSKLNQKFVLSIVILYYAIKKFRILTEVYLRDIDFYTGCNRYTCNLPLAYVDHRDSILITMIIISFLMIFNREFGISMPL